jgi:hypothetical protein
MRAVCGLLLLAACSSSGEVSGTSAGSGSASGPAGSGAAPRAAPPLRIALGDCAPATASFVSGPRPLAPGADDPALVSDDTGSHGGLLGDDAGQASGGFGFGRGGFGPGGSPGGGGGMRGRTAAVPTISFGQPIAQGDLDKPIIRRYLKRRAPQIQYCYEKALVAKPALAGTVMTSFTITRLGRVTAMSAAGVDPEVSSCIGRVIEAIEFPKPGDGGAVLVSYSFILRPAGGGSPPARTSAAAPAAPPPAGPYVPGAASPLRGQEAALTACLRKQPRPYGVLAVDLEAGGKAAVHGLDGDAARTCIVELAGKLPRPQGPAQRCAVAFGDMPIADAPGVEITADELRWLGKRVETPAAVAADDSSALEIPALFAPAAVYAKETAAPAAPVSLRGPIVLRAIDATPMKVIGRVLRTLEAADVDVVLARRGPSDWRLLRRTGPLPIVPVPAGTGGRWSHRGGGVALRASAEDRLALSILVSTDKIRIGVSRTNDAVELPTGPGGPDAGKLERVLAERKRSAPFADRDDFEIAADDAVRYGDVASIIELAGKLGFEDARVLEPAALSARLQ